MRLALRQSRKTTVHISILFTALQSVENQPDSPIYSVSGDRLLTRIILKAKSINNMGAKQLAYGFFPNYHKSKVNGALDSYSVHCASVYSFACDFCISLSKVSVENRRERRQSIRVPPKSSRSAQIFSPSGSALYNGGTAEKGLGETTR